MQELVDRLTDQHRAIIAELKPLLLRVGRRPVSRMAIEDTARVFDRQVLAHERLEDTALFPEFGAIASLKPVMDTHAHIADQRSQLRDGIVNWENTDVETLAVLAEELIRTTLHHFSQEERQLFPLVLPAAERTLEAGA